MGTNLMRALLLTSASVAMVATAAPTAAHAQEATYQIDIPAQSMGDALRALGKATKQNIVFNGSIVKGKRSAAVRGRMSASEALDRMLQGSGLKTSRGAGGGLVVAQVGNAADVADATTATPKEDVEADNAIVVTGTNIRGAGPVGSPVQTFNREDIDRKGYATIPEFIQSLPQNYNGGISDTTTGLSFANGANNNNSGGSAINLRGLGNVSTLTLLNGQRLAAAGSDGSFVDISMIPLSAIRRVEVLSDGASAIYGSDAIGGVVNFIMREDYDGAETRVRYGGATQGGLEELLVGQTFGKTWSGGHGLISYEFHRRDPLNAEDRSFSVDTPDGYQLIGSQKRHSVFLNAGQDITDNFEIFGSAYYNDREHKKLDTFFADDPVSLRNAETEQYGANIGGALRISENWRAEAVGSFSRNKIFERRFDLGVIEPTNISTRKLETLSANMKVDGKLFKIPGGDVSLALGGHYRNEKFGSFGMPTTPIDTKSREIFAVFGELHVPIVGKDNGAPLVRRLEVSVAGRFENYSDFGSSTNPKFGALWSPVEGLNLRGSYGTSFRAPLFPELDGGGAGATLVGNVPDTTSPTGRSYILGIYANGNPSLQPERATIWTAGFDLQPIAMPNARLNLTFFDINYKDRVGNILFNYFADLNNPQYASVLNFDGPSSELLAEIANYEFQQNFTSIPGFGPPANFSDANVVYDQRIQNLSRTVVRGLDFSASYRLPSQSIGDFDISVGGTYLFDYREKIADGNPSFDVVGTSNRPVDLRLNGGISWSYRGLSANLNILHVSGYTNTDAAPDEPVGSWTTANLTIGFDTEKRFGGVFNDTVITLSAVNLFDKDPPFVDRSNNGYFSFLRVNYDPSAANPNGRVVSLQITKRW